MSDSVLEKLPKAAGAITGALGGLAPTEMFLLRLADLPGIDAVTEGHLYQSALWHNATADEMFDWIQCAFSPFFNPATVAGLNFCEMSPFFHDFLENVKPATVAGLNF